MPSQSKSNRVRNQMRHHRNPVLRQGANQKTGSQETLQAKDIIIMDEEDAIAYELAKQKENNVG